MTNSHYDSFTVQKNTKSICFRNYKFYLALENTNCHGYIAEKFFHALRLYETVPIVLRRQYYKDIGDSLALLLVQKLFLLLFFQLCVTDSIIIAA